MRRVVRARLLTALRDQLYREHGREIEEVGKEGRREGKEGGKEGGEEGGRVADVMCSCWI